ncbi:MAG: DUF3943 domain-containing protein [Gemmatimonadales bacterium]|nr:DUF3943 domain-containing protein [Gemmatimonadales bacterium]
MRVRLAALLLLASLAPPALAQGPRVEPAWIDTLATSRPGLSPEQRHLWFDTAGYALAWREPVEQELRLPGLDTVPELACRECEPRKKRFWLAFGELMAVQAIPSAVNNIARDAEWARISWKSWETNVKYPWQWDNNNFVNNQFSHPYHGNLYFNAARANGYNFWASAPWAFGGSLMWELFGEVWAPAPNDFLNTSLGGIAIGETLWRVSSLTLDNTSSGVERVAREFAATLLNPVRGFTRAIDGHMFARAANPPEWRPSTTFGSIELGWRNISVGNISGGDNQASPYIQAALSYGDPTQDADKAPFSTFNVSTVFAFEPAPGQRRFQELFIRGNLEAWKLVENNWSSRIVALMTYEYVSNVAIEFGGQGFQGAFVTRRAPERGPIIQFDAAAVFNPIIAIESDYFVTLEGRDYDYGIGLGTQLRSMVAWRGRALLSALAGYRYMPTVSGFPGDHQFVRLLLDGRYYLKGRFGLGATYQQFWRWANYRDLPDTDQTSTEVRLFVSTAIPKWESY